jgi:F-type H+-transporting ATPase subunit a
VKTPLLRGGNADLNMTFAMSMIFFACWIIWAVQSVGIKGVFMDLFGPKGDTTGALKVLMIIVFFLVGFLEVLSILFRPISLSFRLYGNIFAGENMLESMARLVPGFGWLLPVPFYFMELLVGIVQALVFMLLTAVFTMLICMHQDEHGSAAH